jgi:hypothetical protein
MYQEQEGEEIDAKRAEWRARNAEELGAIKKRGT